MESSYCHWMGFHFRHFPMCHLHCLSWNQMQQQMGLRDCHSRERRAEHLHEIHERCCQIPAFHILDLLWAEMIWMTSPLDPQTKKRDPIPRQNFVSSPRLLNLIDMHVVPLLVRFPILQFLKQVVTWPCSHETSTTVITWCTGIMNSRLQRLISAPSELLSNWEEWRWKNKAELSPNQHESKLAE